MAGFKRALGEDHLLTRLAVYSLSELLNAQGRYKESEPLLRAAIDSTTRAVGGEHWRVAFVESLLGESLAEQGRFEEAEPLLLQAHVVLEAEEREDNRRKFLPPSFNRIVRMYEDSDRSDDAARWREKLAAFEQR